MKPPKMSQIIKTKHHDSVLLGFTEFFLVFFWSLEGVGGGGGRLPVYRVLPSFGQGAVA